MGARIFRVTTGTAKPGKENPHEEIAALFAVAVVAAVTGCASNSAQACIKSAECTGEDDPAAFCQKAQDDCDADADCKEAQDKCATESDALAACLVANGTCDEIDGVDGKFFGVEAVSADGACETQAKDSADCAAG